MKGCAKCQNQEKLDIPEAILLCLPLRIRIEITDLVDELDLVK
jgi:hypothetical protein